MSDIVRVRHPLTTAPASVDPARTDKASAKSSSLHVAHPLLLYALIIVAFIAAHMLLSYVITGTVHYGMLTSTLATWFPPAPRVLSVSELAEYDGADASKPIYIGILGRVFDVTAGRRFYGPDGGYHAFAGRDATRSFVTGCWSKPTSDIRGLSDAKVESIRGWLDFYQRHEQYKFVGMLQLPEIDPNSPPPDDKCEAEVS